MLVDIVEEIDLQGALKCLGTGSTGGIDIFVGTVRDNANGKKVSRLEFEAYVPMALKEMRAIAARASKIWQLEEVVIQHVVGIRMVGEPVVLTAASAPHRDAAFEACRFLIDELKKTVPIWKKEYYDDGSIWVNAHP